MRTTAVLVMAFVALGVCALAFLNACQRESYWERTLVGPFQGEAFNGALTTQPASSLQLSRHFVLSVHWEGATNDPIICLRDTKGTSVWARVLIPRLERQEQPRGRITSVTLSEVRPATNGFKVMLDCDWTGGGKERGGGDCFAYRFHSLVCETVLRP